MPYEGLGVRHEAVATKVCQHGQIVVEDHFVGAAFKALQLTPYVDPNAKDEQGRLLGQQIAVGEEFEIQVGGEHETPLVGELEHLQVGDRIWIRESDNALFPDESTGGTNEVQTVTLANATGGTFTLDFEGDTTAPIAFNATAAAVQAALVALADIEEGDVTVTGSAGGPYTVTFKGRYAGTDVEQMTADGAALTGTSPTVTVATTAAGVPGAGNLPVGVIAEIDSTREPAVARVNANNWQAFVRGA
jgi:hypothetical protein